MAWAGCNTGFGLGLGGIEVFIVVYAFWMVNPILTIFILVLLSIIPLMVYLDDYMSTYEGGFDNPTEEEILKIQSEYVVGE